jgi:hypothetical protein
MNEVQHKHSPGPWTWRDAAGAGLQISATLPEGFKFDATHRGADGKTSFMTWTLRESYTFQIADERWVQFTTGPWAEMQKANAALISAAPDMLASLRALIAVADADDNQDLWTDEYRTAVEDGTAAIAKAIGKPATAAEAIENVRSDLREIMS